MILPSLQANTPKWRLQLLIIRPTESFSVECIIKCKDKVPLTEWDSWASHWGPVKKYQSSSQPGYLRGWRGSYDDLYLCATASGKFVYYY